MCIDKESHRCITEIQKCKVALYKIVAKRDPESIAKMVSVPDENNEQNNDRFRDAG